MSVLIERKRIDRVLWEQQTEPAQVYAVRQATYATNLTA